MTDLAHEGAFAALVTAEVAAGRSRAEALADLRAWVAEQEAAELRRPCEFTYCDYDAATNLDGVWYCGLHAIVRLERQRQANPAAVWRAGLAEHAARKGAEVTE